MGRVTKTRLVADLIEGTDEFWFQFALNLCYTPD
jgi:hypothetical protein